MRIPVFVLLLAALLAGACSDDASPDVLPEVRYYRLSDA